MSSRLAVDLAVSAASDPFGNDRLPKREPGEAYANAWVDTFIDVHGLVVRDRVWVPATRSCPAVVGIFPPSYEAVADWAMVLGVVPVVTMEARVCEIDPDVWVVTRRAFATVPDWLPGVSLNIIKAETRRTVA